MEFLPIQLIHSILQYNSIVYPIDIVLLESDAKDLFIRAIKRNHTGLLQAMIEYCSDKSSYATYHAARKGRLECLKLLIAAGYPKHPDCVYYAAMNGHNDCLRLLISERFSIANNSVLIAMDKGHTDCVETLMEMGDANTYRTLIYLRQLRKEQKIAAISRLL